VTNFILVNVGMEGRAVADALLRKGVIVRSMEGYGLPTYIRVTVGTPQENSRALQALTEVLGTVGVAARPAGSTGGRSKR
jgi:histidinol-phosphate aminotransferase